MLDASYTDKEAKSKSDGSNKTETNNWLLSLGDEPDENNGKLRSTK